MAFLDLLFPPRCAGCQAYGSLWCAACAASVEPIVPVVIGGVPLVAGGRFSGPLQRAIHTYKYGSRQQLATDLSRLILRQLAAAGNRPRLLTFVALHRERERQRGFNQSHRIAVELGKLLRVPVVDGLVRVRPTPAQVGLSHAERQQNMAAAFIWNGAQPAPQGLAVVDDVCTTGATLEAAALAIRQAGGSVAAYLVVARAQTLVAAAVTSREQPACS